LSTQTTSMEAVVAETVIAAPQSQLYHLISTRSGWLDWFGDKGFGNVTLHGILEIHHDKSGSIAFVFQEFKPEELVRFTVLIPKTMETSEAEVRLTEADGGVVVSVSHTGLDVERQVHWQRLWQNALDNLKEILETGKDPRMWNRPFLGVVVEEWVTPEIASEKDLPVDYGMRLSGIFEGRGAEKAGIRGGDIVISLAGTDLVDYDALANVYSDYQAGDTVEIRYYRGDTMEIADLTLSSYPVPDVPATAQDVADHLDKLFNKANQRIDELLEGRNEAQTNFRPAAGEWNAKEILAHLIAAENDSLVWLGSYIAGREVYPYTSGVPARVKMLTSVYPTVEELRKKLIEAQKELVALISEAPAELVGRKSSLLRLAFTYSLDVRLHYKDHLAQLKETLEQAVDLKVS